MKLDVFRNIYIKQWFMTIGQLIGNHQPDVRLFSGERVRRIWTGGVVSALALWTQADISSGIFEKRQKMRFNLLMSSGGRGKSYAI